MILIDHLSFLVLTGVFLQCLDKAGTGFWDGLKCILNLISHWPPYWTTPTLVLCTTCAVPDLKLPLYDLHLCHTMLLSCTVPALNHSDLTYFSINAYLLLFSTCSYHMPLLQSILLLIPHVPPAVCPTSHTHNSSYTTVDRALRLYLLALHTFLYTKLFLWPSHTPASAFTVPAVKPGLSCTILGLKHCLHCVLPTLCPRMYFVCFLMMSHVLLYLQLSVLPSVLHLLSHILPYWNLVCLGCGCVRIAAGGNFVCHLQNIWWRVHEGRVALHCSGDIEETSVLSVFLSHLEYFQFLISFKIGLCFKS